MSFLSIKDDTFHFLLLCFFLNSVATDAAAIDPFQYNVTFVNQVIRYDDSTQTYYYPTVPVKTNVDTEIPCCQDVSKNSCFATPNSNTFIYPQTAKQFWQGCEEHIYNEDAGPLFCHTDEESEEASWKALTFSSIYGVGNCSIYSFRSFYLDYSSFTCYFRWQRTIRICGNVYCDWTDATNEILIQCKPPCLDANPGSSNPNQITGSTDYECNIPWNPIFEPEPNSNNKKKESVF